VTVPLRQPSLILGVRVHVLPFDRRIAEQGAMVPRAWKRRVDVADGTIDQRNLANRIHGLRLRRVVPHVPERAVWYLVAMNVPVHHVLITPAGVFRDDIDGRNGESLIANQ